MKKILALLLAAVMCLSLAACGGSDENAEKIAEYEKRIAELEALLAERDAQISSLLGETEETDTGDENTDPEYETVELTLENWKEYFEIVDRLEIARNYFGEIWRIQVSYYFQLKPQYSERCLGTEEFAVKVEYMTAYMEGTVNVEAETYEITQDFSALRSVYSNATVLNSFRSIHSSVFDDKTHFMHFPYDFEVPNIKGVLYIGAE